MKTKYGVYMQALLTSTVVLLSMHAAAALPSSLPIGHYTTTIHSCSDANRYWGDGTPGGSWTDDCLDEYYTMYQSRFGRIYHKTGDSMQNPNPYVAYNAFLPDLKGSKIHLSFFKRDRAYLVAWTTYTSLGSKLLIEERINGQFFEDTLACDTVAKTCTGTMTGWFNQYAYTRGSSATVLAKYVHAKQIVNAGSRSLWLVGYTYYYNVDGTP